MTPAPEVTPIADALPNLETRRERSLQLALAAARTAADNRGQDIVVLDMRSHHAGVRLLRASSPATAAASSTPSATKSTTRSKTS